MRGDATYVFLATLDPVVVAAVFPVLRLSEAVVAGVVALELLALAECDCFFPMDVRKREWSSTWSAITLFRYVSEEKEWSSEKEKKRNGGQKERNGAGHGLR